MQNLYLQPHQARTTEPTVYEDLLGDSIERAFSADLTELDELVEYLNENGPDHQSGKPWTAENLAAEFKRLGDS
ncbi:MAG TPA: recombinase-like helix-turn-helix domain-containing protein [Burkholderiaceae bacterium]|nr:recombinase-like helix-turn-helix domain-containing protein [Burkholderiaceae bacterium]